MSVKKRSTCQWLLLPLCALLFSSFLPLDFARQRGTASLSTGQTSIEARNKVRLGNLNEAALAYRRTLDEDPNRLAAWQGLARTLLKMNSVSEADEAVQKAQALAGDNAETQCIAGDIHFRRSEFDRAAAAYQAALKLFLEVSANDVAGSFLIDTGAFINVITTEVAKRFSLRDVDPRFTISGLSGKVKQPKLATAFQLAFANLKMQCNYALALDLGPFSDSIGAEISGFLGYDTLSAFCFVLDYREGLVRFM